MTKLTCKYNVGDTFETPAKRTNYPAIPGQDAPLGYFVGDDGNLWIKPKARKVRKVRKTRGKASFDLTLEDGARFTVEAA